MIGVTDAESMLRSASSPTGTGADHVRDLRAGPCEQQASSEHYSLAHIAGPAGHRIVRGPLTTRSLQAVVFPRMLTKKICLVLDAGTSCPL
jgi:hypothetical protein